MSKQRPSKNVRAAKPAAPAEARDGWDNRLFKNSYTRSGRRMKLDGWSVKIQHQGRRHTFSLGTADKETAAIEAKAIYETILAEGWDAALTFEQNQGGFPKTDARFWKEQLLLRRYRFPASAEPEKSFAARISHAGSAYFFPLGTAEVESKPPRWPSGFIAPSSSRAGRLRANCFRANSSWLLSGRPIRSCGLTPRCTHWWAALRMSRPRRSPRGTDLQRVLIVETDAGLRRALVWCINHQPGFCAVTCESPETFSPAAVTHKPKLVLLNRSLAERMGIEFSGGLTTLPSGALALTYSVSLDGDHMFVSTPGGAEGYMLKRVNPANVLDPMIQSGAAAEDQLAPVKLFFKGLLRSRVGQHADALAKLTPRENEVLLLLSKGCVDKEIAQAMGISVWTVHGHIKKIFERLSVRTRTEAVVRYLEK